ncbi:MAG: SMC family ATPase [Anaerolineae bacterium]
MIPLKLEMRNFMCYGDQVSTLDFKGIHLACLTGDNGHGKSAIIDAMTWALWGKARAQRDDDLIHLGETDMEVDFEFILADNHYRIVRQRRKNGTRGQTALEFQIADDGQLRSLTGNTLRQTQAAITETLHMDYQTFINSAFLLQGRADEFTTNPPAERKRILGEILGLGRYDGLEERAKNRARDKEVQLRDIAAALNEIDKELARKPQHEEELQEAERASSELRERLRTEEKRLRELREQRKELDLSQDRLPELLTELGKREEDLRDTNQRMTEMENRIAGYEAVLDQAESIEEGYAALVAARQSNEELSRKLSEQAKLNEERAEVQRVIDEARNRLVLDRELYSTKARELEGKVQQAQALESRLEQVRARLQELAEKEAGREKLLREEQSLSDQTASLRTENEQLSAEMDLLKEKLDLLQEAEAACPLCGTELGVEARDQIKENYASEGRELGDQHRENAATIRRLKESLQETRKARETSDKQLAALPALQGEEATLAKTLDEAQAAKLELGHAKAEFNLLDKRIESGDFAKDENSRLAQLDEQLEGIGYDPQEHEEIRQELSDKARFENVKRELDGARQGLKADVERSEEQKKHQERLQQALEDDSARKEALAQQIGHLEAATEGLDDQVRLVDELQVSESRARVRLGAAQQKLEHCLYLEKEKEKKALEERDTREQKGIYDELREAFGKKGIQAMIIEGVIPEIEQEANRLLSRMTDGRLNVRLKSQRETLKGKTVETLDIEVADELGPRSYVLFSGGEAFRIDFAIRIALSKLLARRAGARLQTLIIDEGFGTQDSQGRERLVEAINSVQEDFERILVITHIEELKDSFPIRIDVFKTPQGSQISVA